MMTENSSNEEDNLFSPEEMQDWLKLEIRQVQLAGEWRIREASAIVRDYAGGRLDRAEANRRLANHQKRWGEVAIDLEIASEILDKAVNEAFGRSARPDRGRDPRSR